MSLQPLQDRVLLKRIPVTETKGGILLPDTAVQKTSEADVLAVGPGRYENGNLIATVTKVGDKVLVGKYAGTEIDVDGEKLVIMPESDILAIVK
jgi:chaperonin GroES